MTALRLVSLDIEDANTYDEYRRRMAPLLERHGGHFVLDVEGGIARIHPAPFDPGRVLLIAFPSEGDARAFFSDPEYTAVRSQWFDRAVSQTHAQALP